MSFQIRGIAVYSHEGERRDVMFKLDALNIVTGASKTGKSALLDIVDYCWGREDCPVAEGEIRKGVSWFAVLFDHDGEGILVARKNPGPAVRTSDEIYFFRGCDEFPESAVVFKKTITADSLRSTLSSLLGISENLYVPEVTATRRPLQASASQALLFCLQAQDEIASKRLMFHRQGESFIPQAIKDALPYFVGAMGEDFFLKQKRYEAARQRLKKLERELADATALANENADVANSLVREGKRVGLIAPDAVPGSVEELFKLLDSASAPRTHDYSRIDAPGSDLADLEERRRKLRFEIQEIRDEIRDLQRIAAETTEFEKEAQEHRSRLASIGLVAPSPDTKHDVCPLCDSHLEVPVPSVDDIRRSLTTVEKQLESARRDNPRLQSRIVELEAASANREGEMRSLQNDITKRIADNERLRIEQDQFTEQARVAGRIGYYLENAKKIESHDGIRLEIARVNAEVVELEKALDHEALEERLATALGLVGRDITRYASALALEHGQNPLRLDRKNLTVVADTVDGPLALPNIGSGENWVGYHVAAHLALHNLFRARKRPIPAFLMLDQPSQAHYPPEKDVGQISGEDEDQLAVTRLFKLLWERGQEPQAPLQIIVTDHVELLQSWFLDSIVQRWRDGIKLVPSTWLTGT